MEEHGSLVPATLPQMYKYAFIFQLEMEKRAAERESEGGAGWTFRATLQAHYDLTPKQFAPFEQAALQWGQARLRVDDEIRAVISADKAAHPGSGTRSPETKAKIVALLAEIDQAAKDEVANIHEALDPKVARKLDEAVIKDYIGGTSHGSLVKPSAAAQAPTLATRDAAPPSPVIPTNAAIPTVEQPNRTPPVVVHSVDPQYSKEAWKKKITGQVMVSTLVTEQGLPTDVRVEKSLGYGLDEEAVKSVSKYRFKPAQQDGKPVAFRVSIEVNFQNH